MAFSAFIARSFSTHTPSPTRVFHHRPPLCTLTPSADEEYQHAEMLDDMEANKSMSVWNNVIHASLKRKLQGLVAEKPVANGVSALLHTAPGHTAAPSSPSAPTMPLSSIVGGDETSAPEAGLSPSQVVSYVLSSFQRDALAGAAAFVAAASSSCHVRFTAPQALVLFVGDNESYRPLLRVAGYQCETPRFEVSGSRCVLSAEVKVSETEKAKFDFQLSCDPESGSWLIDEVFRL